MTTVTIANTEPDQVLNVQATDTADAETGECEIVMVDTDANRTNFVPRDEVTIDWGNGVDWRGEVIERPSESNGRLTYRARGEALPMKNQDAYRVFYEQTTSDIVKALATEKTEQLSETIIHTGSDTSNWSSIAPIAEPLSSDRVGLCDRGSDLLVLGAREDHDRELQTTFSNVPSDSVADGFFELKTRLIFPAATGSWTLLIEFKTPGGVSYRWEPDLVAGKAVYTLAAEDAIPKDSGLSNGELRYRLIPAEVVGEMTCLGIDWASTIPFRVLDRDSPPSTSGVESTNRTVSVRIDESVGAGIQSVADGDNATWYLNDSTIHYKPGGDDSVAGLNIVQGTTNVTDVDAERDFEDIRNDVVVVGKDGVEARATDNGSIDYYGRQSDTVRDDSIVAETAAQERADGIIASDAWNDATVTFTVADIDYGQLRAGNKVYVDWEFTANSTLDGNYEMTDVTTNHTGKVDVSIAASTGRS